MDQLALNVLLDQLERPPKDTNTKEHKHCLTAAHWHIPSQPHTHIPRKSDAEQEQENNKQPVAEETRLRWMQLSPVVLNCVLIS